MTILGIDPGVATVGYGAVRYEKLKFAMLQYGAITTPAGDRLSDRLAEIAGDLEQLLSLFRPDAVAVEELFFNTNQKTAIAVAQARGAILLTCRRAKVPIYGYTPLQVKQAVVGYGRAEKRQVMEMVKLLLELDKIPRPDDAADGLALAICHGHSAGVHTDLMKGQI